MRTRIGLACVIALMSACASPRVVFPTGAGAPVPDVLDVWWKATEACKGAQTFSAELQVNGRVGDEPLRRVILHGAMTRQRDIRLEAVAPAGRAIFILAGRAGSATLTLPGEKRVVVAPAVDIVEALIGIRLSPDDWLDVLSGCVSGGKPDTGERIGDVTIVNLERSGGRLRLDRQGAAWQITAGERPDLLVEYRQFLGRWPSEAVLTSRPAARVAVNLNMAISQVFVNNPLPAGTFDAPASTGFQPMSLQKLRELGPLGAREPVAAPGDRR